VGWLNPDLLYERPLEVLKEKLTLAGSFRMRMRNDKSRFFYHARTKEGKTLLHMGASSDMDETLGPLRSMEFCSEGSLKFVVGKNLWHGKSVQWESRGAFKAHIGHDYSATKDTTRKYIIHHDEGIYGEHGYHKIDETAKLAPHSDIPVEEPELDAHSVDLNIDHNVHVIIGRDEAPDTYDCITPNTHPLDEKSLVVDTSGCWILHIGLSTKKQDRSVFMETDGGLEFVFGKETEFNRSIDMYNHGAVQISIHDKDNVKGQSLHVESSHGWEIDIDDADDEGYGATVNIRGNVRVNITGDTTLQVLGNVTETVQGNVQRTVQGNLTQMIMGNLTDMVMGNRMHITSGNKMYM